MSDNDVDDLARVLAEHRTVAALTGGLPLGGCSCGQWTGAEMADFRRHQAAAVLASGVVVSAREVKALADEWDRNDAAFVRAAVIGSIRHRDAAQRLRSLLREPAPTGREQR